MKNCFPVGGFLAGILNYEGAMFAFLIYTFFFVIAYTDGIYRDTVDVIYEITSLSEGGVHI